ncbi:MAG: hypothetical protein K6E50_03445 [Lachnospiraceae bacterium]|nr:hypothetical protein [Lachnospiraceae bacterium]
MDKITDFDIGDEIRLTTIDGEEYEGQIDVILWEDETDGESHLSLDVGDRLIGFDQNEIQKIVKLSA